MSRRGFTIVELLMVIGVISVLITITAVSVTGALRRARSQRASAVCTIVKQGLNTYYAQKGVWPWGDKATGNPNDSGYYTLSASEVRNAVFELVKEAKKHNPMMDISGLYVSTHAGEPGSSSYGMDFMAAVKGSKQHPQRIAAGRLYYGYPESSHGYFRRFVIKYSPSGDDIIVRTFTEAEERAGGGPQSEKNNEGTSE